MLTERENALRTILGNDEPEWVPISSKCYKQVIPSTILERPKGGSGYDWFGCYWRWQPVTFGYAEDYSISPAIEDVCDWEKHVKFPDLDAIDWEAGAKADLADWDRENQLLKIFWESGPFERSHHLLGYENALISMYEEPEAYKDLIWAITEWRMDAMGRLIDAYHPDVMYTHDDLGTARGPMMSHELYEEFIKPCHYKMEHFLKEKGVIVVQHSCGMIEPFIGDMIECGADVVDTLQGTINNQIDVMKKWGDKTAFSGGLSPFVHSPRTTEEELRAEVRRAIDVLGAKKRYIMDTFSLNPGYEDILMDEAEKYGYHYWERHGVA